MVAELDKVERYAVVPTENDIKIVNSEIALCRMRGERREVMS